MQSRFRSKSALLGLTCSALIMMGAAARAQTAVTITSPVGARQTFQGFGTSQMNWGGEYQTLTQAQRTTVSQTLWAGLRFKIFRLWFNTDEYSPTPGAKNLTQMRTNYINSGMISDALANGVTTLLLAPDKLPPYMGNGSYIADAYVGDYAVMLADAIKQMKDEDGVIIHATGIQNEPNNANNGPGMFTPAQIVTAVKALRVALDARGLQYVKIIASEAGSVDQSFFDNVDALKADTTAWNALAGISSHSYSMGATDGAANRIAAPDGSNLKEYWQTESSDNGSEVFGMTGIPAMRATSLATRFLNDMNHRTTHWVHFIGLDIPDTNDNATRIGYFTIPANNFSMTLFKKYYTYKQLSEAFDVGAVFRDSQSSLEGDMTWTYGKKPRITSSTAKNPDGSWSVGIANYTSNSFDGVQGQSDAGWNESQGGYTPAQNFSVKVKINELQYTNPITFNVFRTDGTKLNQSEGTVTMVNGEVTLPVNSLDVVTLRSTGTITYTPTPTPTPVQTGKIRFWPRTPYPDRMLYGVFQGTNGDPVSGPWTELATINTLPMEGQWNQIPAPDIINYTYVRYLSPPSGYGNVAEIEFYSGGVKLTGTPYGSAPFGGPTSPNTFAHAFDGDTSTIFDGADSQAYAGLTVTQTGLPLVSLTSPTSGQAFAPGSTINLAATASDPNGTITQVQFYQGTTLLSTDISAPYTYAWAGAALGTYSVTAKATDNSGNTTTSTAVNITVANSPNLPTVSLTSPANGSSFAPGSTVNLAATAADSDGTIAKVEFFQGATLLSTDTSAPYNYSWSNVPAGNYNITAKATDNGGNTATSAVANINVSSGIAPSVYLTSPTSNTNWVSGSSVPLAATATDSDGTISQVQFYQGATLLSTDSSAPYTATWTAPAASGTYTFTAKATDNLGNVTTSAPVNISVNSGGAGGPTGTVNREVWTGIPGSTVATIPVTTTPNISDTLTSLQGPSDWADNYGTRIRGFIHPPTTGTYTFWVAGDDAGELWLSTNNTAGAKVKIASFYQFTGGWNSLNDQKSGQITLTAGQPYYVEVLQKENAGGDAIRVGWLKPGQSGTEPSEVVPGTYLSPFISGGNPTPTPVPTATPTPTPATPTPTPIPTPTPTPVPTATPTPTPIPATPTPTPATPTPATPTPTPVPTATPTPTPAATGVISREVWTGVSGNNISDVPVTTTPSITGTLTSMEGPTDWADSYATRLRGYITAPATGSYTFWTAGDDAVQLWLSTNSSPANKVLIAFNNSYTSSRDWTSMSTQRSGTINLTAGQQYYVEVLHKEGGGGDNLAIGWLKPGQSGNVPSEVVPGSVLSAYSTGGGSNSAPTVSLTSPANGATFASGATVSLAATAADSDGTVSQVQFYQGTTLLGTDTTAPYTYSWTGAAAGTYSLTAKATDNSGATTTSTAISITVNAAGGGTGTVNGSVTREVWTGITGSSVSDIPLTLTPNISDTLTMLEGPSNWADNYGTRIKGFITAPTTGSYTFWIAGDDAGQFWLSTDSNAANKVQLCSFYQYVGSRVWNNYPGQKSATISLTAGQKYYFEILHKEGAGGDSIAVGWLKPGQTGTVPSEVVPSTVLSY